MKDRVLRPQIDPPAQIAGFIARLQPAFKLSELWLFGSRARETARADSDWDLLAVVPDDTPDSAIEPVAAWDIARPADFPITLLVTRKSDLDAIWGLPNTIGYDLAREGVKIRVD